MTPDTPGIWEVLLVARHPEVRGASASDYGCRPISHDGWAQVRALAQAVGSYRLRQIQASPSSRCLLAAKTIGTWLGVPVIATSDLKEFRSDLSMAERRSVGLQRLVRLLPAHYPTLWLTHGGCIRVFIDLLTKDSSGLEYRDQRWKTYLKKGGLLRLAKSERGVTVARVL